MEEKNNPPPYSPPQLSNAPPGFNAQPGYPQPGYPQPGYNAQPGFHIPPPGQPGPPPVQHQQHTVIVTHSPPILGAAPAHVTCPSCHAQITTTVQTEATTKTHLFALLLCLFGCWPCCCIPYCMDGCQGQNHYCPSCKAYLGRYEN